MPNFYLTCHVEPQGKIKDITYLPNFFAQMEKIKIPVFLFLMYGGTAGDRILRMCGQNRSILPVNCPVGLHIHGGQTGQGIKTYEKYFGSFPKLISFGHWSYKEEDLKTAQKFGVEKDFSHAAYRHDERYFFKNAFKNGKIWRYPVSCDPKYPVYPFSYWYHLGITALFVIYKKIFPLTPVHISFHSYDWQKNDFGSKVKRFLALKLLLLIV